MATSLAPTCRVLLFNALPIQSSVETVVHPAPLVVKDQWRESMDHRGEWIEMLVQRVHAM